MSQINVGFDNNSPQAIDRSYGPLSTGRTVPYSSIAAANAAVVASFRHRGKTVLIDDGTGAIEYWWRVDTQDVSLVPKIRTQQKIDLVIGTSGPAAGQPVYQNDALKNCVIDAFLIEGAEIADFARTGTPWITYDPTAGQITLNNTVFSNTSWYRIKFRQL